MDDVPYHMSLPYDVSGGVGGPLLAERAVKIRLLPLLRLPLEYFIVRQRTEKLLEPMTMPPYPLAVHASFPKYSNVATFHLPCRSIR